MGDPRARHHPVEFREYVQPAGTFLPTMNGPHWKGLSAPAEHARPIFHTTPPQTPGRAQTKEENSNRPAPHYGLHRTPAPPTVQDSLPFPADSDYPREPITTSDPTACT